MYKKLVRGLRRPRTSISRRLYEQFAAYISRGLCSPRLIFPRINRPFCQGLSSQRWWSWVSFGHPLGSSWLELDQMFFLAQNFAQLEPSFPPLGHLKPTLAKLSCYCYVTTRSYSDNWMVSCKLAQLGGIIWWAANASFDFVTSGELAWVGSTVWPGLYTAHDSPADARASWVKLSEATHNKKSVRTNLRSPAGECKRCHFLQTQVLRGSASPFRRWRPVHSWGCHPESRRRGAQETDCAGAWGRRAWPSRTVMGQWTPWALGGRPVRETYRTQQHRRRPGTGHNANQAAPSDSQHTSTQPPQHNPSH